MVIKEAGEKEKNLQWKKKKKEGVAYKPEIVCVYIHALVLCLTPSHPLAINHLFTEFPTHIRDDEEQ